MRNKSIKRNFIMNTILSIASFLFSLITFPYISRILNVEDIGRINFVNSIINYALTFAMLGLPIYGVKACAKVKNDKYKLVKTVRELFCINIILAFISILVLICLVLSIRKFRENINLFSILVFIIPLQVMGLEWLYKALEAYDYIAVITMCFKFVGLILMFLFVKSSVDYIIYAGIILVAGSGQYIFNFIRARKYFFSYLDTKLDLKTHIKPLLALFFLSISWTIYNNTDVIMLGFMADDTQVGYYSMVLRIKSLILVVVTSLGTVILPKTVEYFTNSQYDKVRTVLKKSSSFILLASLYFSGFIMMEAKNIISLLAGDKYIPASSILKVMVIRIVFVGLSSFLGTNVLLAKDLDKVTIKASIYGIVVNIILNFLLIPRYSALGAAIATVIGEGTMVLYEGIYLRRELLDYFDFRNSLKILLSFSAALIINYFTGFYLGDLSLLLYILISGMVYTMVYFTVLFLLKESIVFEYSLKCNKFFSK